MTGLNKEWLEACEGYSTLKGIPYSRAYQLSILLWVNSQIGVDDVGFDPTNYLDFALILDGKQPFKGRWVKSESKRKTQGVIRPVDDPTCFSFDDFWKQFGNGKGSKKDCLAVYCKIGEEDRQLIKDTLHLYVQGSVVKTEDLPKGKFLPVRCHPVRYLNGRYWDNYADQIKERDWNIPVGGEFTPAYYAHNLWRSNNFPDLNESPLVLTYSEYCQIKTKAWEKDFKANVGPDILAEIVNLAHLKSLDHGGLVYDNFIALLKEKD